MKMKWIGLTGGIATGKSTVAKFFRDLGVPVVCADQLARDAVQNGTAGFKEVVRVFGPGMVSQDGSLDRKALGALVFGAPEKLRQLESIIHPEVRRLQKEERAKLEAQGHAIGVYDVPLLFEKNLERDFDATIVVTASPEKQKQRLIARDNLSADDAQKRIDSQLPLSEKIKRADFVIDNNGTESDLHTQIHEILAQVRRSQKPMRH